MPDNRRTRLDEAQQYPQLVANPELAYTPLDQIGVAQGGMALDHSPGYNLPDMSTRNWEPTRPGVRLDQSSLSAGSAPEYVNQGDDSYRSPLSTIPEGLGRMGSAIGEDLSGLGRVVGRGVDAFTPDQGTIDNIAMRFQRAHAIGQGTLPAYLQEQNAMLDMRHKRAVPQQQLEARGEMKRQHDMGLFEKALSHPRASMILDQLSQDQNFAFAKQAGALSKTFKEQDYGSMKAYMSFIPEEIQQRFLAGDLPHEELTSWVDMAREEAKMSAKANVKQTVLKRAMEKPEGQRSPFEQSLVEERQAALETEKLKRDKILSETNENNAQADKYRKESEGGPKTSPVVDSISNAFHGVPFNQLPAGSPQQQDVLNRYGQLYSAGRNAVELGSPAPVEKRSNVVDRKAFLQSGALNRPTAGVSKGQLAKGDYIELSDKQQEQAQQIEMAKENLTSMFGLVSPLITAETPAKAALQYAKLKGGAMTGAIPEAATYQAGSEAFSSVFSRVFGGEVGVMTDRDIARWQATLPTFGDTKATAAKKKELFFKIYDAAVVTFRKRIAGEDVGSDKKNIQGLLSKVESPQSTTKANPSQDFIETRTTKDGRKLGKTKDGQIVEIK